MGAIVVKLPGDPNTIPGSGKEQVPKNVDID